MISLSNLNAQFLTPTDLARIMNVSARTVTEWMSCKHHRSHIAFFKKGRVVRFAPEAVLQFVIAHTILGNHPRLAPGQPVRLEPEQFELLWQRVERLLKTVQPQPQPKPQPEKEIAA